jgi:hypothetical protein
MIDYVELHVPNPDISILAAKLPVVSINKNDLGRTYKSEKGQFGNLLIVGTAGILIIKGSIHKYFNELSSGERENLSRLHLHGLVSVLEHLSHELGFALKDANVKTIEVGFNLQMNKDAAQYLQRIGSYLGGNGISYNMSTTIHNNIPFMKSGEGQGIVRKLYDKCKDHHISKEVLDKYKNLLRIELRIKRFARSPFFPRTAAELVTVEHLEKLSNLVKDFARQLIISGKLNIDNLSERPAPNNIIKHLLLGRLDYVEICEIIQNTDLTARQKRLTMNTLRDYMQKARGPRIEKHEMMKEELRNALEKEIDIFFQNV